MSANTIYYGRRVNTFDPAIGEYLGTDGIIYYVGSRVTVKVTEQLFFSAGAAPVVESEFLSNTKGILKGLGVILDSTGKELFAFYPESLIKPANKNNPNTARPLQFFPHPSPGHASQPQPLPVGVPVGVVDSNPKDGGTGVSHLVGRASRTNSAVDRELYDALLSAQWDDTMGSTPDDDEKMRLKAKREALLGKLHSSGRIPKVL